jgi:hypothetical protein
MAFWLPVYLDGFVVLPARLNLADDVRVLCGQFLRCRSTRCEMILEIGYVVWRVC